MAIDPTVKKILNNGGFIAALAPLLASRSTSNVVVGSAERLAEVAITYSAMLGAIGANVTLDADWEGCEQAQILIGWINDAEALDDIEDDVVQDMVAQLDAWADVIWSAIADLAAGKVPKLT